MGTPSIYPPVNVILKLSRSSGKAKGVKQPQLICLRRVEKVMKQPKE